MCTYKLNEILSNNKKLRDKCELFYKEGLFSSTNDTPKFIKPRVFDHRMKTIVASNKGKLVVSSQLA